jgi:hypothetical protein
MTDIIGYEGKYSIDIHGNIFSYKSKKFLTPCIGTSGYPSVLLYNKKRSGFLIHRLVAFHFLPNPSNLPFVNHIDGNKTNFSLDNLEWSSHSQNMSHAYKEGLNPMVGENHHRATLTNSKAREIKSLLQNGHSIAIISDMFKVSEQIIRRIKTGKTWRYL